MKVPIRPRWAAMRFGDVTSYVRPRLIGAILGFDGLPFLPEGAEKIHERLADILMSAEAAGEA